MGNGGGGEGKHRGEGGGGGTDTKYNKFYFHKWHSLLFSIASIRLLLNLSSFSNIISHDCYFLSHQFVVDAFFDIVRCLGYSKPIFEGELCRI